MLLSILICVYYIRLIRFIWFVEHNSFPIFKLNNISSRQAYNISFFSILNIFAFFFQGPLLIWINNISIEMIIYA
jgi:hypothetical protein